MSLDGYNIKKKEMDYLQFCCKECKFHSNGVCRHPDVYMNMEGYCRACFRLKVRKNLK